MIAKLLPAILWTVFVISISLTPGNEFPKLEKEFEHIDKLVHVFLYSGLSFLWYYDLRRSGIAQMIKLRTDVFLSFVLLGLGVLLETLQHFFVPMRTFDIWDIVSNGIGIVIGFSTFYFVIYRRI
ncbi:MAG: VanZ family protein [Crocinitomicaceae bacterium]